MATLNPAALLKKLRDKKVTGYAQIGFTGKSTVFLYYSGRLITVLFEAAERRLHSLDALTQTFETIATEGGRLDAYGLSHALAGSLQALFDGQMLHQGQDLRLIDAKALLAKLKVQQFTGCVRVYTADTASLILYKDGAAIGFFHDGSREIETSASSAQRVAGLPGAKLDVLASQNPDQVGGYDILDLVDVDRMWSVISRRHADELARLAQQSLEERRRTRDLLVAKLSEEIKGLAESYLGKVGRSAVGKALESRGGDSVLLGNGSFEAVLTDIETAAKLLTGQTKTMQMLDAIRQRVRERMQNDSVPWSD